MELKKLSDLFWTLSPNLFFLSVVMGIVTGFCYGLLIPFVIHSVVKVSAAQDVFVIADYTFTNSPTTQLGIAFIVACLLVVAVKTIAAVLSIFIASKAAMEHRLELYRRINRLSIIDLERMGQARIINILTLDTQQITGGALCLPNIWISSVTIIGLCGYLAFLDFRVFVFVCIGLLLQLGGYYFPTKTATRCFFKARNFYDQIQEGVRGLVFGAKELKMSESMSREFYREELLSGERGWLRATLKGQSILRVAENASQMFTFLIIGAVIFHLSYVYTVDPGALMGVVMVLVYLTGPITNLSTSISSLREGEVALQRLKVFYNGLESEEEVSNEQPIDDNWTTLEIRDLHYQYESSPTAFAIKNINLTFKRGEITYIVGGNGSGKSTLSKCLSLHYKPTQGHVAFNDQVVEASNLASARENISVIYSDYHLFRRIYTPIGEKEEKKIERYLKYLGLHEKVTVVDGQFSTTNLSDGQKKRLALLVVMLQDRDVCVFDEWAAEQDPEFKDFFYSVILNELKAENKVIIVISHDDQCFKYADRMVEMSAGQVKRIIDPKDYDRLVVVAAKPVEEVVA